MSIHTIMGSACTTLRKDEKVYNNGLSVYNARCVCVHNGLIAEQQWAQRATPLQTNIDLVQKSDVFAHTPDTACHTHTVA
jgi:hypothetical protein